MKILLAIANYGSTNKAYLLKCLSEYNSYKKYKIDCHLYVTENIDVSSFKNLNITVHKYNQDIKDKLPFEHKILFSSNINKYEYYLYCEDDILITENNVDSWINVQNSLPMEFVCGFVRYEIKNDSEIKHFTDLNHLHSVHRGSTNKSIRHKYIINDKLYAEPYNFHQGSYLINNDILHKVLNTGNYFSNKHYVGNLEGAASDIYMNCNIIKIIPIFNIDEFCIHHLSNKYISMECYNNYNTPNNKNWETWE